MLSLWNRSDTYAHAWVVPPIAIWLAWRSRQSWLPLTPRPSFWVLAPLALVGVLWLLGDLVGVNTTTQLAFAAMLVLAVPAMLGTRIAWELAFPLAFLFFAVPAGDGLTPLLMQGTADFTIMALRLTGVPVYREGLQFVIPSGNWSVVETCSGIRYLMASVMVGTLFAYLNYQSTKRRLIFIAVSMVVPVIANWLRAYMIVMLGHLSGNRIAVGADHLLYGWVFFGIVIMALYWLGARWAEPSTPLAAQPDTGVASSLGRVGLCIGAFALLLAWPLWAHQRIANQTVVEPVSLVLPVTAAGDWRTVDELAPSWQPAIINPVAQVRASYQHAGNPGERVGLIVAYYRGQNESSKVISSLNRLIKVDDQSWNQLSSGTHVVPVASGAISVAQSQIMQTDYSGHLARRQRLLVNRAYWVDGQLLSSDVVGKLRGAWSRIQGENDDAAYILFYTDDESDSARSMLDGFMRDALPDLLKQLQSVRRLKIAETK
jgi:exosortase A